MQNLELQIGKVIIQSREIETLLREIYNAEGKGLHQLVTFVENSLIRDNISIKEIRKIASIRNDVTHNSQGNKHDLDNYQALANKIMNQLKKVHEKKLEAEKEREKKLKEKFLREKAIKEQQEKEQQLKEGRSNKIRVIIITIIVLFSVYFFMFSGKNEKELKLEINNLNIQIQTIEKNISNIKENLKIEKEKQGTLRNIFSDNDIVNELQDKLDIEERKLSDVLEKKANLQVELKEKK